MTKCGKCGKEEPDWTASIFRYGICGSCFSDEINNTSSPIFLHNELSKMLYGLRQRFTSHDENDAYYICSKVLEDVMDSYKSEYKKQINTDMVKSSQLGFDIHDE